jgi:hypothetical protein
MAKKKQLLARFAGLYEKNVKKLTPVIATRKKCRI